MSTATVLVKNADRMMNAIKPVPEGIELSFADGCSGVIPFADIPGISGLADLDRVELPTPYEAVLWSSGGETAEIPWDFARAYCDPSYRSRVEAVSTRGRIALRWHRPDHAAPARAGRTIAHLQDAVVADGRAGQASPGPDGAYGFAESSAPVSSSRRNAKVRSSDSSRARCCAGDGSLPGFRNEWPAPS